jgi:hypothetical protein
MHGFELTPDILEHLAKQSRAMRLADNWKSWYDGADPVVRSVVSDALYHLGMLLQPDEDEETLRKAVDWTYEMLDATKDWIGVQIAAGAYQEPDANGETEWIAGDITSIDAVDHLMAISEGTLPLPLEHELMFLTLGEAKANRPGVAVKAFYIGKSQRAEKGYRQWQRTLGRKGKRKPSEAITRVVEESGQENPGATSRQIWEKFPDLSDIDQEYRVTMDDGTLYELSRRRAIRSRKGEETEEVRIIEVHRNTQGELEQQGRPEHITFDSFRRYVTKARKKLRKP